MFLVRQTNQHMLFTGKYRYINTKLVWGNSHGRDYNCLTEESVVPACRCLHFFVCNIFQMTAHSSKFLTSPCSSVLSWSVFLIWYFTSSAKRLIHLTSSGKSFINTCIRNRIGPSTLPWGIPEVIFLHLEQAPLTVTYCFLWLRKSLTHVWMFPLIPYPHTSNILMWETLSNALVKSRLITSTSFDWSLGTVISWSLGCGWKKLLS